MKVPMVFFYTASGATPAVVMKEVGPELLNLWVIHQTGRTELIEHVHRVQDANNPTRHRWDYMEPPEEAVDAAAEADLSDA